MLEKKIINGSNFIIKLGTNKLDIMIGLKKLVSTSLKNSISSNRFKINPKLKTIKIVQTKFSNNFL